MAGIVFESIASCRRAAYCLRFMRVSYRPLALCPAPHFRNRNYTSSSGSGDEKDRDRQHQLTPIQVGEKPGKGSSGLEVTAAPPDPKDVPGKKEVPYEINPEIPLGPQPSHNQPKPLEVKPSSPQTIICTSSPSENKVLEAAKDTIESEPLPNETSTKTGLKSNESSLHSIESELHSQPGNDTRNQDVSPSKSSSSNDPKTMVTPFLTESKDDQNSNLSHLTKEDFKTENMESAPSNDLHVQPHSRKADDFSEQSSRPEGKTIDSGCCEGSSFDLPGEDKIAKQLSDVDSCIYSSAKDGYGSQYGEMSNKYQKKMGSESVDTNKTVDDEVIDQWVDKFKRFYIAEKAAFGLDNEPEASASIDEKDRTSSSSVANDKKDEKPLPTMVKVNDVWVSRDSETAETPSETGLSKTTTDKGNSEETLPLKISAADEQDPIIPLSASNNEMDEKPLVNENNMWLLKKHDNAETVSSPSETSTTDKISPERTLSLNIVATDLGQSGKELLSSDIESVKDANPDARKDSTKPNEPILGQTPAVNKSEGPVSESAADDSKERTPETTTMFDSNSDLKLNEEINTIDSLERTAETTSMFDSNSDSKVNEEINIIDSKERTAETTSMFDSSSDSIVNEEINLIDSKDRTEETTAMFDSNSDSKVNEENNTIDSKESSKETTTMFDSNSDSMVNEEINLIDSKERTAETTAMFDSTSDSMVNEEINTIDSKESSKETTTMFDSNSDFKVNEETAETTTMFDSNSDSMVNEEINTIDSKERTTETTSMFDSSSDSIVKEEINLIDSKERTEETTTMFDSNSDSKVNEETAETTAMFDSNSDSMVNEEINTIGQEKSASQTTEEIVAMFKNDDYDDLNKTEEGRADDFFDTLDRLSLIEEYESSVPESTKGSQSEILAMSESEFEDKYDSDDYFLKSTENVTDDSTDELTEVKSIITQKDTISQEMKDDSEKEDNFDKLNDWDFFSKKTELAESMNTQEDEKSEEINDDINTFDSTIKGDKIETINDDIISKPVGQDKAFNENNFDLAEKVASFIKASKELDDSEEKQIKNETEQNIKPATDETKTVLTKVNENTSDGGTPVRKEKPILDDGELSVKFLDKASTEVKPSEAVKPLADPTETSAGKGFLEKFFDKIFGIREGKRKMSTYSVQRQLSSCCTYPVPLRPSTSAAKVFRQESPVRTLARRGSVSELICEIHEKRELKPEHDDSVKMRLQEPVLQPPAIELFAKDTKDLTEIKGGSPICKTPKSPRELMREKKNSRKIKILGGSEECAKKMKQLKKLTEDSENDCDRDHFSISHFFRQLRMQGTALLNWTFVRYGGVAYGIKLKNAVNMMPPVLHLHILMRNFYMLKKIYVKDLYKLVILPN